MKKRKHGRTLLILVAAFALVAAAAVTGLHVAIKTLKGQVEQALGPESEVAAITVGWSSIELQGLRIRGPKGWPAQDALRAERIVIHPDLLGLFSARLHVPRITIERAYVSALRARDGRFRLLPSLLERSGKDSNKGQEMTVPVISIGKIELRDGVLEFFDATVRRRPHRTRLEQLQASVTNLRVPSMSGRTGITLDGTVKGVQRNGTVAIKGWAELAAGNSNIVTKLRGVDLVALQPYLIKASETGVRRGTLDLKMNSTVRNKQLHAPGSVTLSGLELAPGNSVFGTFMGIPRQAVITALKNRDDQITIDFTLEGDLNDPRFSLNDSFAMRVGAAVAETLGISLEGLARGVGSATEGLGGMVKKLFGQ